MKRVERIAARFVPGLVGAERSLTQDGRPGKGHRVMDTRVAVPIGYGGGIVNCLIRARRPFELALIEALKRPEIGLEAAKPWQFVEKAELRRAHPPWQALGQQNLDVGNESRGRRASRNDKGNQRA